MQCLFHFVVNAGNASSCSFHSYRVDAAVRAALLSFSLITSKTSSLQQSTVSQPLFLATAKLAWTWSMAITRYAPIIMANC
jgi:hypothetical protein